MDRKSTPPRFWIGQTINVTRKQHLSLVIEPVLVVTTFACAAEHEKPAATHADRRTSEQHTAHIDTQHAWWVTDGWWRMEQPIGGWRNLFNMSRARMHARMHAPVPPWGNERIVIYIQFFAKDASAETRQITNVSGQRMVLRKVQDKSSMLFSF
jgi:hypothetical protein